MHCLITALGSYGDVHPMLGLGNALTRRGHEVEVIANPHFEQEVRRAGLPFVPLGTAEEYDGLTRRPELWSPYRGPRLVIEKAAISKLEALYDLVERRYRPRETVIAAHGLDLASRLLAEKNGAPVASIVFAPMALWSSVHPPRLPVGPPHGLTPSWLNRLMFEAGQRLVMRKRALRPLERFRRSLGLARVRGGYLDWYYGVSPPICLFPDWFANNPGDWPAGTLVTGFPLWEDPRSELSADQLGFLQEGSAPIVFTPGSANRDARGFFRAAVEACQRLKRRGVLLTKYRDQTPSSLPEGVRWFGFAPLGKVLGHSAAFVHHGGVGSSARGLAAGRPQLIQPLAFDQFDNAMRLRRLGVAEEIPRARFDGQRVADSLGRLMNSTETGESCRRVAERLSHETPLERACEALERRLPVRDQYRAVGAERH